MPTVSNLTVRIRAIDEVTPVLKAIQRKLWWWRYGPSVAAALVAVAGLVVGFTAGLQVP